ncbi:adenylate/guanylate cyclase domain-containing protein [Bradyrhizobium brasilense]|uniref:adenylate/guanylate cyclase domain-containing protein n=1 Tax=Bradyrhizobium brasilense TaxID=1419277 RepID=UPI001456BAAE|nr:adenylate/guanylate cyclase domain-containing protein [Bradyrhizobium brasilense]NLS68195.1 adenylate/guanylate cyclase domain-containing protein [Bradyrhizobium brasilense]
MSERPVQRRLAAILAADVVGYSSLMERAEEATYALIEQLRQEIVEPRLAKYHGRLIKTTGDGVFAEFASPVAAVRCASELQDHLNSTANALKLRIGINLGDVIVDEGGDVFGEGINIAARLEGLAEPGGILISGKVHAEIDGKLEIDFEDRGELQLKNISKQVRAFAVRKEVHRVQAERPGAPLPLPDKPSIAVLPFQNMSGDPEQEYFADGIVEDMITALSHFQSLFVIARNSSFTYKGKAIDIRRVGQELGVRYVVEGSVRKAGGRIRITGQLIDARTGAHLWADKFDGALDDIFDLQDTITASVVGMVAPTIEQAEIERAKQKPTDRLDCYDLYLRGTANMYRRSTLPKALELLKLAIEKDKEFGAAYSMAAFVLLVEQASSGSLLSDERRKEAVRFAERAVRLRPDDALVLAQSAHVLCYLGYEYDRALVFSEQAIKLNGNLAPAWHSRGWIALMCVMPEQAIESFQRMMRLSPLDPLTPGALYGSAFAYFLSGRHEEGLAVAGKAVLLAANAHSLAAFIINATSLGRSSEAKNAAAHLQKIDPNFRVAHASDLFPTRSLDARMRIASALREAGLPE